jgi:hypothetical protein
VNKDPRKTALGTPRTLSGHSSRDIWGLGCLAFGALVVALRLAFNFASASLSGLKFDLAIFASHIGDFG